MPSVHAYGGSNTYGIGDPEGGGFASRLRSTMIGRRMNPVEGRRGIIVHNLARFGMTLPQIVAALPDSLASRDGRGQLIAAAMVGFSDSAIAKPGAEPNAPFDKFCQALLEFTAICDNADYPVHRLFIESPPMDLSRPHPGNTGEYDHARMAEYNEAVKAHAQQTGAGLIETHDTLLGLPQDPLSEDGIHLSIAGHIAVHDLLLAQVDALFATPESNYITRSIAP